MRSAAFSLVWFTFLAAVLPAQDDARSSQLSLLARPTLDVPVADSAPYFAGGATVDLGLGLSPGGSRATVFGGLSYAFAPKETVDSLSIVAGRVGAAYRISFSSRTAREASAEGAYYYGTLNDFSIGFANPYAAGGAALDIALTPGLSLGIGAIFRSCFELYQGVSIGTGTRLSLSEDIQRRLSARAARAEPGPATAQCRAHRRRHTSD